MKFRGELLTLRNIEKLHKKPKADKETRLATAMVRHCRRISEENCWVNNHVLALWLQFLFAFSNYVFCESGVFYSCRQDAQTERNLSKSAQSWTHMPAQATRRKRGTRTLWWWDRVRTSEQKANGPSERNRQVKVVSCNWFSSNIRQVFLVYETNKKYLCAFL